MGRELIVVYEYEVPFNHRQCSIDETKLNIDTVYVYHLYRCGQFASAAAVSGLLPKRVSNVLDNEICRAEGSTYIFIRRRNIFKEMPELYYTYPAHILFLFFCRPASRFWNATTAHFYLWFPFYHPLDHEWILYALPAHSFNN